MTNFSQALASTAKKSPAINPFAQALAEAEREKQYSGQPSPKDTNPFSDALSQTGGSFGDLNKNAFDSGEYQRQLEEQRKKEALRKKLHDQVNPVDATDIFNAKEQQVKREIEEIRRDLLLMVGDLGKFHKEVQLTLMTETVSPGLEGKGYKGFFHQLKALIKLMRQQINSARTWATQLNGKKRKKAQKGGAGMMIDGAAHEKTSTVQDMMHHERSNAYSGG